MVVTRRYEDVEAIRELAIRYAHYVDDGRASELGDVFSEDAVWDASSSGFGVHEGRDAIIKLTQRGAVGLASSSHYVVNHLVERLDGDEAEGTLYTFGERRMDDGKVYAFNSIVRDRYVRTDEGWRIRSRVMRPVAAPSGGSGQ